jgi:hypothetical protein
VGKPEVFPKGCGKLARVFHIPGISTNRELGVRHQTSNPIHYTLNIKLKNFLKKHWQAAKLVVTYQLFKYLL